jgi:peptide chain release factor 1
MAIVNPYQAQIDQLVAQIAENQMLLSDPELGALAQQEIEHLTIQKQQLEEAAASLDYTQNQTTNEPTLSKNCIVEIRPGAGGDEGKIWANDLLRMYIRFAEKMNLKMSFIDDLVIKFSGKVASPLTLENHPEIELNTPYLLFRGESGVHRVQRVPATESQGRIHTSTASVAVLPEVSANAVVIREEDLEWQFMRASGAGGQSVNKTSSAVRLIHGPSGIAVTCSQEKQQEQNRKIALELLRAQLWQIEEDKRLAAIGDARSAIGRNMRAEKIRTYNYPQNRVTDHRINVSWHSLDQILEGNIEKIITETAVLFEEVTPIDESGNGE